MSFGTVTAVKSLRRALCAALPVTVAAGLAVVGAAPPALAETASDPGPGLTVAETLGIFVGIPALIIAVIYLLVYGLTSRRGPRNPVAESQAQPVWFGGPDHPEHALEDAEPTPEGGGARGSW
jgi:hypothetical protein